MSQLQIFENQDFGNIRTLLNNGKPLFCGNDVARALGYSNTRDALARHCRGVVKHDGVSLTTNQYGVTTEQRSTMSFIPEGDVYRLITHSKLPRAEQFERWVFDEVLPTIRKNGTYTIKPMTDYQSMIAKTRAENARIRKAQILERIAKEQQGSYRQILQAYATKELTGEFLLPLPQLPERTYNADEIGQMLGCSAQLVGRMTNQHNLKTSQYGAWFKDKAKSCNKEVSSFRYYKNIVPVLKQILEEAN